MELDQPTRRRHPRHQWVNTAAAKGLDEDLQQGYRILKELIRSNPHFVNKPEATPEMDDYFDMVPKPMWLLEILRKFDDKEYTVISQFASDVRLMLENCYTYHGPESDQTKKALRLEQAFEQKLNLLPRYLQEQCSIEGADKRPEKRNKNKSVEFTSRILQRIVREREQFEQLKSQCHLTEPSRTGAVLRQSSPVEELLCQQTGVKTPESSDGYNDSSEAEDSADQNYELEESETESEMEWDSSRKVDSGTDNPRPEHAVPDTSSATDPFQDESKLVNTREHESQFDTVVKQELTEEPLENETQVHIKEEVCDKVEEVVVDEEALKKAKLWEQEVLLDGETLKMLHSMWELVQVGQFLTLGIEVLHTHEVSQYELERAFLMPKASKALAMFMTSMLSNPLIRSSLYSMEPTPVMPYQIWTGKLARRVAGWYKVYQKHHNPIAALDQLGVEPGFWKVLGEQNPLEEYEFHELNLHQRVWLIKTLCDVVLVQQQIIRDAVGSCSYRDCYHPLLGEDRYGAQYLFCHEMSGREVRLYWQNPKSASWNEREAHYQNRDKLKTEELKDLPKYDGNITKKNRSRKKARLTLRKRNSKSSHRTKYGNITPDLPSSTENRAYVSSSADVRDGSPLSQQETQRDNSGFAKVEASDILDGKKTVTGPDSLETELMSKPGKERKPLHNAVWLRPDPTEFHLVAETVEGVCQLLAKLSGAVEAVKQLEQTMENKAIIACEEKLCKQLKTVLKGIEPHERKYLLNAKQALIKLHKEWMEFQQRSEDYEDPYEAYWNNLFHDVPKKATNRESSEDAVTPHEMAEELGDTQEHDGGRTHHSRRAKRLPEFIRYCDEMLIDGDEPNEEEKQLFGIGPINESEEEEDYDSDDDWQASRKRRGSNRRKDTSEKRRKQKVDTLHKSIEDTGGSTAATTMLQTTCSSVTTSVSSSTLSSFTQGIGSRNDPHSNNAQSAIQITQSVNMLPVGPDGKPNLGTQTSTSLSQLQGKTVADLLKKGCKVQCIIIPSGSGVVAPGKGLTNSVTVTPINSVPNSHQSPINCQKMNSCAMLSQMLTVDTHQNAASHRGKTGVTHISNKDGVVIGHVIPGANPTSSVSTLGSELVSQSQAVAARSSHTHSQLSQPLAVSQHETQGVVQAHMWYPTTIASETQATTAVQSHNISTSTTSTQNVFQHQQGGAVQIVYPPITATSQQRGATQAVSSATSITSPGTKFRTILPQENLVTQHAGRPVQSHMIYTSPTTQHAMQYQPSTLAQGTSIYCSPAVTSSVQPRDMKQGQLIYTAAGVTTEQQGGGQYVQGNSTQSTTHQQGLLQNNLGYPSLGSISQAVTQNQSTQKRRKQNKPKTASATSEDTIICISDDSSDMEMTVITPEKPLQKNTTSNQTPKVTPQKTPVKMTPTSASALFNNGQLRLQVKSPAMLRTPPSQVMNRTSLSQPQYSPQQYSRSPSNNIATTPTSSFNYKAAYKAQPVRAHNPARRNINMSPQMMTAQSSSPRAPGYRNYNIANYNARMNSPINIATSTTLVSPTRMMPVGSSLKRVRLPALNAVQRPAPVRRNRPIASAQGMAAQRLLPMETSCVPVQHPSHTYSSAAAVRPSQSFNPAHLSDHKLVVVNDETGSHYALELPGGVKLKLTPEQVAQVRASTYGTPT